MRKIYSYLAGALLATTSLASCSSSQYAFKAGASPYHDAPARSSVVVSAAQLEQVAQSETISNLPTTLQPKAQVAKNTNAPRLKAVTLKQPRILKQMVVAKVAKQLHKHQEVAKATQEQSRAGRAGIIIGIGAVIILIGGLIGGANIVATIGGVTFLVGLILLIIALISGK